MLCFILLVTSFCSLGDLELQYIEPKLKVEDPILHPLKLSIAKFAYPLLTLPFAEELLNKEEGKLLALSAISGFYNTPTQKSLKRIQVHFQAFLENKGYFMLYPVINEVMTFMDLFIDEKESNLKQSILLTEDLYETLQNTLNKSLSWQVNGKLSILNSFLINIQETQADYFDREKTDLLLDIDTNLDRIQGSFSELMNTQDLEIIPDLQEIMIQKVKALCENLYRLNSYTLAT